MMKKIISVLLAFTLVVSYFSISFADNETEVTSEQQSKIDMMFELGLMEYDILGKFRPERSVSRADFCKMISKALNMSSVIADNNEFTDVKPEDSRLPYINIANQLGIMNGKGNGIFAPDEAITYQEVITAFIRALGYEELAKQTGGWFSGYYNQAKKIGLLDDIVFEGSKNVTFAEMAVLMYNFLNTEIFTVISVNSDGGLVYTASKDKTVLSEYHNILFKEDILTENKYTSLKKSGHFNEEHIKVGNVALKNSKYELSDYLGYRIKVWYDEQTLDVLHYELSENNNVLVVSSRQDPSLKNSVLTYTDGDRIITKNITAPYYIYNRNAITSYNENLFELNNGAYEFIDNNNDGRYDVVNIKNYTTAVIERLDVNGEIIYLANNHGTIRLNDYEKVTVLNKNNEKKLISYLHINDVISIMENKESDFIEIVYSQDNVTGTAKAFWESDNTEYVSFDNGEEYPLNKAFLNDYPYVKTGTSGIFGLDIFGNVSSHRMLNTDAFSYAYILATAPEKTFTPEVCLFKLLCDNGEILKTEASKYVYIDGKQYKNPQEIITALTYQEIAKSEDGNSEYSVDSSATLNHLVRVKFNEEGKISHINTTKADESQLEEDFKVYMYELTNNATLKYYESSNQFNQTLYLSGNCKVFRLPTDISSANEDNSRVLMPGRAFGDEVTGVICYKTDSEDVEATAVVQKLDTSVSTAIYGIYERICVIESKTLVALDDGTVSNKTYYHYKGDRYEAYTKNIDVLKDVNPGDVVMLSTDIDGYIDDYKPFYNYKDNILDGNELARTDTGETDSDGNVIYEYITGFGYNQDRTRNLPHRAIIGEVYKCYPGVMQICVNGKIGQTEADYEFHRYGSNIYLVTDRNGKIKVAPCLKEDIRQYVDLSSGYSKVFVFQTYGYDYDIVIYNN